MGLKLNLLFMFIEAKFVLAWPRMRQCKQYGSLQGERPKVGSSQEKGDICTAYYSSITMKTFLCHCSHFISQQ